MNVVSLNKAGDPVVIVVLDEIFSVSQIDPSSIVPDYKLGPEFGMTASQVSLVLSNSAKELGIQVPFESCRLTADSTARDIVTILKRWQVQRQVA